MGRFVVYIFCVATTLMVPISSANTLAELVDQTIATAKTADCSDKRELDTLQRIVCDKQIQIGVRGDYRSMSVAESRNEYVGYEADLARLIAQRLGVSPKFTTVNPTNRIEKLLNGEIDLVLATMSHTAARDKVVTFIRPHYYSSPSSIFGPANVPASVLTDLRTQTVCVPLNTFFSSVLAENNIRMIIYDKADRLVDAVRQGSCMFIAHDQSFLRATFASKHTPPELKGRVLEKMSFLDVPTGMGVRNDDKSLGVALGQIVAELHQSGVLVESARQHDVLPDFLEKQQKLWSTPQCAPNADGLPDGCLGKAADLSDRASSIASQVKSVEDWLSKTFGIEFTMPMLSGQIALKFFLSGLLNSTVICFGAIAATLIFALLIFGFIRSKSSLVKKGGYGIALIFQNTPIILLFIAAAIILNIVGSFTPTQTIIMSIIVIGLSNGANAAVAMKDTLDIRNDSASLSLKAIVVASFVQIRACLVNAAKGSPVASFVGTPELLSVMTNITAFTGTRSSTYFFMIIFYLISVQLVVVVCNRILTNMTLTVDNTSNGKIK